MGHIKRIALVAHDKCKKNLIEWVECNRATADFIISSSLIDTTYENRVDDFGAYINRTI